MGNKVKVRFLNQTPGVVRVFWVKADGSEKDSGEIASGSKKSVGSFENHKWRLKDANLELLEEVTVPTGQEDFEYVLKRGDGAVAQPPKTMCHVKFYNDTPHDIDFYYVKGEGDEQKWGDIPHGGMSGCGSYAGHVWTFKTSADNTSLGNFEVPSGAKNVLHCVGDTSTALKEPCPLVKDWAPPSEEGYECVTLADALSKIPRGGPFNLYTRNPLPELTSAMAGKPSRFVDIEFPAVEETLAGLKDFASFKRLWDVSKDPKVGGLQSHGGTGEDTIQISVQNDTADKVKVFWATHEGIEDPWGEIESQKSWGCSTYRTHIWVFRKEDGTALGWTSIEEAGGPEVKVSQLNQMPVVGEASLFGDKPGPDDIRQGGVGNCWFLQAVSAIAKYPDGVRATFEGQSNLCEQGLYVIRVLIGPKSTPYYIVLDDYIPCKESGRPCCAKTEQGKIWVCLLEKAWAKMRGGWGKLKAGQDKLPHPFFDLLGLHSALMGGVGHTLNWVTSESHRDVCKEWQADGRFWELLKRLNNDGRCTISTSTNPRDDGTLVGPNGLVNFHGYAILDTKEFDVEGKPLRLIQCRNTWHRTEWNGRWSDKSEEWDKHPTVKAALGHEDTDEGTFWMDVEDYYNSFCCVCFNYFLDMELEFPY